MSNTCKNSKHLLQRNGTSQSQRDTAALKPENTVLMDLSTQEWMQFAFQFAKKITYFDTVTDQPKGTWENFFLNETEIQQFVSKTTFLETNEDETTARDVAPHLTLFAAFLKLTTYAQRSLNKIPERHLDFYYGQVLKILKNEAEEDTAHILLQLAKNAPSTLVPQGTELIGGKDATGKKRIYRTTNDIVVNNTTVASLRSIFNQPDKAVKNAFVSNSHDGLGADFPDGDTRWWPFGHPLSENFVAATSKLPELPVAKMGFGMAAPVLELKEGKRTVTFTITSDYFEESKPINSIAPQLSVFFSGEKEWIEGEIDTAASSLQNKKLTLAVVVSEGAAAITGYDKEVLLEPYETTLPVVRFLWDQTNGNAATHGLQEFFGKSIVRDISINVAVEGLQDFVVENDQGAMDPAKPFYPFGTQPVAGSNFYIGLPETLQKKWGNITVSINWKDAPKDFASHYLAYRRDYLGNISKNTYDLTLDENGNLNSTPRTPIVDDNEYFTASVSILKNGGWDPEGTYKLFDGDAWEIEPTAKANEGAGAYKAKAAYIKYSFKNTFKKFWATEATNVKRPSAIDSFRAPQPPGRKNFSAAAKTGFVRITLNTSFLHELFPKLYSVALSKIFQDNTLIPNEPYTPMVASLTVGYTASAGKKNIQFFHEHPFGVSLEDKGRKRASVLPAAKRAIKLFPSFNQNSLYIGLENAAVQQQVSLLVQVLEGSENPEYLDDGLQLSWSILCDNEWLSLDKDFIVSNNTDNFLKTGIVTLAVPKVATTDNTKFPDGLFWVKVSSNRAYDATSQLVGVFAQAVPAQFDNRGNSLEHLEHGLGAESISKLVQRISPIKKAEQPFNSFGGAPKESNSAYYRRISERLRHKNRAIALWDYEHIVLQKFPYVYKANCLPHTSVTSSQAPGRVTVVVIPNVVNKNVYDIYKPRISTAKRNEIKDHINLLNTLHVSAQVINPDYEAVKVQVDVRFYDGYDAHFYELQLKKDITKLLSPWAFEETNSIDFGVTLHESKVIHYIEKLEYVDFISDFKMKQKTGPRFTTVRQVAATKPQGIITSVPFVQHQVTAIPKNVPCTPLKFEPVAETELEGDIEIEML